MDQIAFIEEIADDSVQLLKRILANSPRGTEDAVLAVLCRQSIAMFDSIAVGLRAGAVYAAFLPFRSLFEAVLSMEWILGDKAKRGRQFFVGDVRRRKAAAEELLSKSSSKFKQAAHREHPSIIEDLEEPQFQETLRRVIDTATSQLAAPPNRSVNSAFEGKKRNTGKEPQWFQVYGGPGSLQELARKLKYEAEYLQFYGRGSEVMHGNRTSGHIVIPEPGTMMIQPIRSIVSLDTIWNVSITFMLRMWRLLLLEYRPEEWPRFRQKYMTEWRARFHSMPEIRIEFRPETE